MDNALIASISYIIFSNLKGVLEFFQPHYMLIKSLIIMYFHFHKYSGITLSYNFQNLCSDEFDCCRHHGFVLVLLLPFICSLRPVYWSIDSFLFPLRSKCSCFLHVNIILHRFLYNCFCNLLPKEILSRKCRSLP